MTLPRYMLTNTPQNMSGLVVIIRGPGSTPWMIRAPMRMAVTTLEGRPRESMGTKLAWEPELLAVSGPARPSMAPCPNFLGVARNFLFQV